MQSAFFRVLPFVMGQAPQQPPGRGGLGDMLAQLWWFPAILVIMYFLMLRPQRKREKERQQMISTVKRNDEVVTVGGIHGVVRSTTEKDVVLLVDPKSKMELRFSRSAIGRVVEKGREDSKD